MIFLLTRCKSLHGPAAGFFVRCMWTDIQPMPAGMIATVCTSIGPPAPPSRYLAALERGTTRCHLCPVPAAFWPLGALIIFISVESRAKRAVLNWSHAPAPPRERSDSCRVVDSVCVGCVPRFVSFQSFFSSFFHLFFNCCKKADFRHLSYKNRLDAKGQTPKGRLYSPT